MEMHKEIYHTGFNNLIMKKDSNRDDFSHFECVNNENVN